MTTPEKPSPTNVSQALARVMAELPAIGKNKTASPQQGGYSYRGIEEITAVVQSLFSKYGVVFVPKVTNCEIKDLLVNSKPWTDTILTVEYGIYGPQGPSDSIICGPIIGIGRDNSDKGANKAMTQAFKYALLQVLCISDQAADADGQAHEADTAPQTRVRHVQTKPDLAEAKHGLKEILDLLGDQKPACVAYIMEKCDVEEASEMTVAQTNEAQKIAAGWPATGPHPEQPSMGDKF